MPRWEPNTRMRLVESALERFERDGYDATGVAQIAEGAGLTKTTFFRQFPDKREVLFAGQEDHCRVLRETAAGLPADASPLEAVAAALGALAATIPDDRHELAGRLQAVIEAHPELRERAALKRAGYLDALTEALAGRGVPEATTAVAADLGVLAFHTGYGRWVAAEDPPPLADAVDEALAELRAAGAALR